VVCGNIIGNISDPLVVGNTSASAVSTCVISISSLAAALVVVVMTSIIVVVTTLVRSKAKIKAALEQSNVAERIHMDPMYEDVTGPLSSATAIDTNDNIAYGHNQFKYIQYEDNAQ
jgi:hypothetical protein